MASRLDRLLVFYALLTLQKIWGTLCSSVPHYRLFAIRGFLKFIRPLPLLHLVINHVIGVEWFEDQELILRFLADLYSYRAKLLHSLLSPPDGGTLLIRGGNKN